MINAVDVVVDQFIIGWYGSSLIEAAALGKMIITYVDRERWEQHINGLAFPPVREGRTREQIGKSLRTWRKTRSTTGRRGAGCAVGPKTIMIGNAGCRNCQG